MSKIKVERPGSSKSTKKAKREGIPRNVIFVFVVTTVVVFTLAGFIFFRLSNPPLSEVDFLGIERFSGDVQIFSQKEDTWGKLTRAGLRETRVGPGDSIRTGPDADIDLKVLDLIDLRLKPSSELEILREKKKGVTRLHLVRGSMLGRTGDRFSGNELIIETKESRARTHGASFLIRTEPEAFPIVSVLDGSIEVTLKNSGSTAVVKALHVVPLALEAGTWAPPKHVTYQLWRALNEVRDLVFQTREEEKKQLNLRVLAGNFFEYVFDEGTFFSPNMGYAVRKYFKDQKTGETHLRIDYDVFPGNSFVGVYFKVRGLDLSKIKRFKFELKSASGQPVPKMFSLEVKRGRETARGFAVKPIEPEWRLYSFEMPASQTTLVDELVFVFQNSKIGPLSTKGSLYLRNLTIE
jgi:hypothetical protein